MKNVTRRWIGAGACLAALLAAVPAPAAGPPQRDDTPTLTNSSLEAAPEPLPAGWPAGAADAQVRGAACETAYGADEARRLGAAGDDLLGVVGTESGPLGFALLPVRRTPFLARRDVAEANLVATKDASVFEVHLRLTEEGARKAQAYSTANLGTCVALVAGGRVVWTATLDMPVATDVFVLSGGFNGRTGLAIVDLFGR